MFWRFCLLTPIWALFLAILPLHPAYASDRACDLGEFGRASWSHEQRPHQLLHAPTDHYALVFSWSPGFCAKKQQKNGNWPAALRFQCDSGNEFGWIVHGLWPQSQNGISSGRHGGHPRYCRDTDLPDLSRSEISPYACLSPGATLLQGQWEKHGACAFDKAETYFQKMKYLADQIVMPDHYLEFHDLFAWVKRHNPQLAEKRFWWRKGARELAICFDRQFQAMDCR